MGQQLTREPAGCFSYARLREGEDERALAADLARVHGVTLAGAEYFVETLSGAERSVA